MDDNPLTYSPELALASYLNEAPARIGALEDQVNRAVALADARFAEAVKYYDEHPNSGAAAERLRGADTARKEVYAAAEEIEDALSDFFRAEC